MTVLRKQEAVADLTLLFETFTPVSASVIIRRSSHKNRDTPQTRAHTLAQAEFNRTKMIPKYLTTTFECLNFLMNFKDVAQVRPLDRLHF